MSLRKEKNLNAIVATLLLSLIVFMVGSLAQAQTAVTFTPSGTINVRSGDGIQYEVVIASNESLEVIGRNTDDLSDCKNLDLSRWLQVRVGGVQGWVVLCGGTVEGDVSSVPLTTPSNPVLRATSRTAVAMVTASGDLRLTDAPADSAEAFVLASIANVRQSASVLSARIGTLSQDPEIATVVTAIGRNATSNWVLVQYATEDGEVMTGWVSRRLLLLTSGWEEVLPVR